MTRKLKWKVKEAGDSFPNRWTLENEKGGCLGFRHFPKNVAILIGVVENHFEGTWFAKKVSTTYMKWLRRNS